MHSFFHGRCRWFLVVAVALLWSASPAFAGSAAAPEEAAGTTTQRVVVDAQTGFAIGGFDPVAYFAEGVATPGRDGIEANWEGAIWRFANDGDRQAFLESPEIYAPQFGGHCAYAAATGAPAEGNPLIFAIAGGRLYLFQGSDERARFLAKPEELATAARRNWPGLASGLAR